jgi:hypothetical protein
MLRCDLSAAAVGGCEGSCGGTDVVWGQVEHRRCVGSCSTRSAGATDGAGAGIRQKRLAFRHSHAHFPIPTVKKLLLLWLFSLSIKQKKRKKMEGNENNRGRTVPSIWNRLIPYLYEMFNCGDHHILLFPQPTHRERSYYSIRFYPQNQTYSCIIATEDTIQ